MGSKQLTVICSLIRRFEPVAHTPNGVQVFGITRVGLDLLAQAAHMYGDSARIDIFGLAPDMFEQLVAVENLARVAHEPPEQLKLLRREHARFATDGDVAQKVAHPRHGCHKTYEVKVRGQPDERSLSRVRKGMVLDGYRLRPAGVSALRRPTSGRQRQANSWWLVELAEGRSRQIREMFKRIGHPVMRLRRLRVGSVELGSLKPGQVRVLDDAEVRALTRRKR